MSARPPRPPLFADRDDAGRQLATALRGEGGEGAVVLGLARGGIPVAAVVAEALDAPLDVLVVRKVGHPANKELAIGAVTPSGEGVLAAPGSPGVQALVEASQEEARAMERRLHGERSPLEVSGRTCILVDDGLATGATMVAACRHARAAGAARVIAAVPVASLDGFHALREEADDVVCPFPVADFWSVSLWYRHFGATSEDEVRRLLDAAQERRASP